MKYMGVAEAKAKLSECIEDAQREPVVILSHGRPAAMVVGLSGMSLDEVAREDAQLLKLLAERSHSPTVTWKDAKARLARKRKRR
jgi:prevent-host-death family protein